LTTYINHDNIELTRKENLIMKHGDYLRSLLKEKKVKTRHLYEKMNISKTSVNFKINGQRQWKPNEIDILINELNMSYEEIFKKDNIDIIPEGTIKITIGNKIYVAPVGMTRTIEELFTERGITERKVSNG
jgi:archaellum component FlaF (FlaF/FlaG flagellin family)